MNRPDYPAILTAKHDELERRCREIISGKRGDLRAESHSDPIDEAMYVERLWTSQSLANADTELLREVNAALDRLADGTYGICIQCDKHIAPARLAALPWAKRCVKCQEADDKNRAADGPSPAARRDTNDAKNNKRYGHVSGSSVQLYRQGTIMLQHKGETK